MHFFKFMFLMQNIITRFNKITVEWLSFMIPATLSISGVTSQWSRIIYLDMVDGTQI